MPTKTIYSCQKCGYQSPKWLGRCPDCSSWSSFAEESFSEPKARRRAAADIIYNVAQAKPVLLRDIDAKEEMRLKTNIRELDRVLGGGAVKGGVVLLGGDPGIGKSTIALQISNRLAKSGFKVLYVSGEESVRQTKMRAERLGAVDSESLYIVNQTDLSVIIEYVKKIKPDVLIIDSIQVLFDPEIASSPGSVVQVRECSNILTQLAKASGISMFIIGHVTKEGTLAGPRVLEHIVDTVLYFEGDRHSAYRILRTVKNRFGSTNEIGVFQMKQDGLSEVSNPSEIFLTERPENASGSVVTAILEGTRPMLLEVQALVARSSFGYAQRRAEGFDYNRLSLIVAVLEKRIGLHLEKEDIFVNIAGGVKVDDPSCDLAVVVAVASNFKEKLVRHDTVVMGEVGLAAEIRSCSQMSLRVKEARELGFKRCIIPKKSLESIDNPERSGIELATVNNIREAFEILFG